MEDSSNQENFKIWSNAAVKALVESDFTLDDKGEKVNWDTILLSNNNTSNTNQGSDMNSFWYGVRVTQMPLTHEDGSVSVFSTEVYPSRSIFQLHVNRHFPFIHNRGRSFRNLFNRWYFEVHEECWDAQGHQEVGTHHQDLDGGGFSFRRTADKASDSVDNLYWTHIPGYSLMVEQMKNGTYKCSWLDDDVIDT